MTRRLRTSGARAPRLGTIAALAAAAIAAVAGIGCERLSRPNVSFPEVSATGLDGTAWTRERMAGRPWVVNLWVPG